MRLEWRPGLTWTEQKHEAAAGVKENIHTTPYQRNGRLVDAPEPVMPGAGPASTSFPPIYSKDLDAVAKPRHDDGAPPVRHSICRLVSASRHDQGGRLGGGRCWSTPVPLPQLQPVKSTVHRHWINPPISMSRVPLRGLPTGDGCATGARCRAGGNLAFRAACAYT